MTQRRSQTRGGDRARVRPVWLVAGATVTAAALALALTAVVGGAVPAAGGEQDRGGAPDPGALRLTDVAADVGLDFRHGAFRWGGSADPAAMMGAGLCWLDADRDGWMDLFVTNSWSQDEWPRWQEEGGLPTSALFHNHRGRFEDVSQATGTALDIRANGCVAADLDRDGWTDLYVTSDRSNVLLWNRGDGTFEQGEGEAARRYGWQAGAAVGDVDGNGWPDLFLTGYVDPNRRRTDAVSGFPNTHEPLQDVLYLNEGPGGDGRAGFREADVGLEVGALEYGLGVLMTDVDADGDLDVHVANDTNPNRLYENMGAEQLVLREVAVAAGTADANSGMGVAAGDLDGTGSTDLVVTNLGQQTHAVFHNRSVDGPAFQDALPALGIDGFGVGPTGWGVSFGDLDLDTDLDLVAANGRLPVTDVTAAAQPLQVFSNQTAQGDTGRLVDVSEQVGVAGLRRNGRGLALADFDNDGDLDVAVNAIGQPLVLLRTTGSGGHWLTVDLGGPVPGAVVQARLGDGTVLHREVQVGSSYLSSEDPRVHLGLGARARVEELRITWPGGHTTVLEDVAGGRVLPVSRPTDDQDEGA